MKSDTRYRADCCCCCGHGVPIELLKRYAKGIPKVELHVHIEGTIRNRLAREISRENGLATNLLFQDSSCSSSECNSSCDSCTTSCEEFLSSSSETEPHDTAQKAQESFATDDGVTANTYGRTLHCEECTSVVRNTGTEHKQVSSGVLCSQVSSEETMRQQVSVVDRAKISYTMSNTQKSQDSPQSVACRRRRVNRSKELCSRQENKKPTEMNVPRAHSKRSDGETARQNKDNPAERHEDLWRQDPEFYGKLVNVKQTTSYLRNKRMHIYPNLDAFILDYRNRAFLLRKADDYYKVLLVYLESAAADNVRHVEFHFAHDPATHIPWREQLRALHKGCCEAERRWGITTRKILGFLRHMPVEEHLKLLNEAEDVLHMIDAVGLVASEKGNENKKFKEAFDIAKSKGLHCVAHAGEEGPAANVRDAITYNHAERIDHGLAAVEDEEVLFNLIQKQVPLTVCPLSNVCLGACRAIEEHPLLKCRPQCALLQLEEEKQGGANTAENRSSGIHKENEGEKSQKQKPDAASASAFPSCIVTGSRISRQYPGLIDNGLKVTISSDDPAFFGGGVYNNFRAVIETNRRSEQQRKSTATELGINGTGREGGRGRKHVTVAGGSGRVVKTGKEIRGRKEGAASGIEAAAALSDNCFNSGSKGGNHVGMHDEHDCCASCRLQDTTLASPPVGVCVEEEYALGCGRADCSTNKAHQYEHDMVDPEAKRNITRRSACTASTATAPAGENNSGSSNGDFDPAEPPLLQESLHWRLDTVKQVAINSVEASFLTPAEKQRLFEEIETFDIRFRRKHSIGPRPSGKDCT